MSRPAPAAKSSAPASTSGNAGSYLQASQRPIVCLVFILPLLVLYEVGTQYTTGDVEYRVTAFVVMQRAFEACRVYSPYLPAVCVVALLMGMHIVRRDSWKFRLKTLAGMFGESLAWGIVLLPLNTFADWLAHEQLKLSSTRGKVNGSDYVAAVGAGIYEELLFRLILFSLLSFLLIDVLKMKKWMGYPLIVLTSAVLFAAYHGLGDDGAKTAFQPAIFTFRTLAGVYLGIIFLWRGFGVSVGSHACYDLLRAVLIWAGPFGR